MKREVVLVTSQVYAYSKRPCDIRLLGPSVYKGSPLLSLLFAVAAESVISGGFDAIGGSAGCSCELGTALRAAADCGGMDCNTSCDGAGCCCASGCSRAGGGGMLACCCRACSKAAAGTCCCVCCADSWLEAPGVHICCTCSLAGRGCICMSCCCGVDCRGGRVSDV